METTKSKTVICPIFASAQSCAKLFGIGESLLPRMADSGITRRKIAGNDGNTEDVFHVGDIYNWMTS